MVPPINFASNGPRSTLGRPSIRTVGSVDRYGLTRNAVIDELDAAYGRNRKISAGARFSAFPTANEEILNDWNHLAYLADLSSLLPLPPKLTSRSAPRQRRRRKGPGLLCYPTRARLSLLGRAYVIGLSVTDRFVTSKTFGNAASTGKSRT